MFRLDHHRSVEFCDGWRRRDFLRVGSAGLLGLSELAGLKARGAVADSGVNVIWINLVGGPSQLDTFDPKPDAPSEIRGPFRPIRTNVAGVEISDIFPRLARRADRYAILRTLHHDGSAVHDVGHQLMQTGRSIRRGEQSPNLGCSLSRLDGAPPPVILPAPIGATGGNMSHGQDAGCLGAACDPFVLSADGAGFTPWREQADRAVHDLEQARDPRLDDPHFQAAYAAVSSSAARQALDLRAVADHDRARYGLNRFGESCLLARRLTGAGVRFVTVNMFETVFDEITWDIHGTAPFSPIDAYAGQVGPMFDRAFSALLDDLSAEGRLERTLLVAAGEFGRTPRINPAGGRDHWTNCWSILMAGGGVRGGQVIGASDAKGAEPAERPIEPAQIAASVCHALGVAPDAAAPTADGGSVRLVEEGVEPIHELFG
ncbi:MAG: DUF1501 domain-containing protein [Acidobacteria bacterium]|nr:DUF1501 domain-containing protein [Acidobacteriota bacterium]